MRTWFGRLRDALAVIGIFRLVFWIADISAPLTVLPNSFWFAVWFLLAAGFLLLAARFGD